jgi:hypothetical protein
MYTPNLNYTTYHDSFGCVYIYMQVVVPAHPLVRHWVSVLRDRHTPTAAFSQYPKPGITFSISTVLSFPPLCPDRSWREPWLLLAFSFADPCYYCDWSLSIDAENAMAELGRTLTYEATKDWLVIK